MRWVARRKATSPPDNPMAKTSAGNHDSFPGNRSSTEPGSGRCKGIKTSQPKKNMILSDSNGGISNVRIASDGHVAHSGIASAPMQVQVLGDSVRCPADRGLSTPNHNVVSDIL